MLPREQDMVRWKRSLRRLSVVVAFIAGGGLLAFGMVQAQPMPSPVSLHAPDPERVALFGSAVAAADVNGDGMSDVIVGAPSSRVEDSSSAGEVFVFLAPDLENTMSLHDPTPEVSAFFGASVAAGDVDGDGRTDLVVGAPGSDVDGLDSAGEVFVFLGPDLSTALPLQDTNPEAVAYFGASVAVGDIDRDGRSDVIVGAHVADLAGEADAGEVFVFSGGVQEDAVVLSAAAPQEGAHLGSSLATGDVNGDGALDVIAGAEDSDCGGEADAGEAFVFLGADLTDSVRLRGLGPEASAEFGRSVAAGDLDGDRRAEVIVGAKGADVEGIVGAGRVFVFSGDEVTIIDDPSPETNAWFGFSVTAGDVNDDGLDDVIVGSSDSNVDSAANAGQAFVFLSPGFSEAMTLNDPSPEPRGHFGVSVAAGDVNDDGAAEVIVGAHYADFAGVENTGEVHVFQVAEPSIGPTAQPVADATATPDAAPAATSAGGGGDDDWRLWGSLLGGAGIVGAAAAIIWRLRARRQA